MKLKRKHFARLKEIATETNESGVFGMTGIKLEKLITDIESVQKPKTIQEKPLNPSELAIKKACDKHRKDVEDDFIRQSASSINKDPFSARAGRDAVEAIAEQRAERPLRWSDLPNNGKVVVEIGSDLYKLLDPSDYLKIREEAEQSLLNIKKSVYDTDPKIGEVGFFWDSLEKGVYYGKVGNIYDNRAFKYEPLNYGTNSFKNFSKTPPELK